MLKLTDEAKARVAELQSTRWSEGTLRSAPFGELMGVEQLDGRFMWIPETGWYRWDQKRWIPVGKDGERLHREAHKWVVAQLRAAVGQPQQIIATIARYRDVSGLKALVEGAKTSLSVAQEFSDLDGDPMILNCRNGIVDLRTGSLMPHDPGQYCTHLTGGDFEPGATHPDWEAALEALDPDDRHWLQVRLGQAATGLPSPDDVAILCQGGGSNGKTLILDAVKNALGSYASVVMDSVVLGQASHPTEVMALKGLRLALMEELPEGRYLQPSALKKLVGSGTITARVIRGNPVEFRASHTLLLTSNYLPRVGESDHGTWRRLRLLPFPYRYVAKPELPNDRVGDRGLKHRLIHGGEQRRAILAWLVAGAVEHHRSGFPEDTAGVVAATAAWREGADLMHQFIAENIEADPGSALPTVDVFKRFSQFLEAGRHKPMSEQTFKSRFLAHPALEGVVGATKMRRSSRMYTLPAGVGSNSLNVYTGVRWRAEEPPAPAPRVVVDGAPCRGCGEPLAEGLFPEGFHPNCGAS